MDHLKHINDDSKEGDVNLPKLEVEIEDMSLLKTYISSNPNFDVLEDRHKKVDYSRKEMNLVFSRAILARQMVLEIDEIERVVFFFKYPKLSKFCLIALVIFILGFDSSYFLSYMLGIFIVVFVLLNKNWKEFTEPALNRLFFN